MADKYTIKKTCFNNIEENTLVELYSLSKDSIKQVDNKSFHEVTILMSAIREEAPARLKDIEDIEAEVTPEIATILSSNMEEALFINEIESLIN
ncbi:MULTISPECIES: hypothetical protein [Niallia]|uniref:Uncharacterized protein n=1 Tax=Niallia taxi TaxID=2499688 RepID=A0A3S2W2H1_9BACI|nr:MULTISPECIES: hypothetical protein [Niallia]MDK8642483.1 hypothetical protein [Niallia taxi]MED4040539.1 hypothetical protein [Niallia taxi]MED4056979.1 hypothetical protein [Niallia taxi]MED4121675.1 hypothetical protein [Niallia taxi]RVT59497.1 hypothetical protein EM808_19575 [Niallia taxi]